MKTILLLLSFAILTSETCKKKNKTPDNTAETGVNKPDEVSSIPKCVQSKIDSIKNLPRFNPPAEMSQYEYNGKQVFLFSSDCCDQYNVLVDESCNYVCAPSGGFTGKGDMKCNDFAEKAKLVKLVWKDERK